MEKRRIRLEINGVVCGLITQESEEYMQSLGKEVGDLMQGVMDAAPFITREAAALTAALSCCDDARKNGKKAFDLQERVDELEVEAELWQEEKAEMEKNDPAAGLPDLKEKLEELRKRAALLEERNTALEELAGKASELEARAAGLEDENAALRQAAQSASAGEDAAVRERLQALEQENGAWKASAEKAEQEKQSAVAAAKRAMEEARKRVDQLQEEAEAAKAELERVKRENASPALDALEQAAAEHAAEIPAVSPAPEQAAPRMPKSEKKRRNPLRHEEEFEQQGFVSFFEKAEI